MLTSAMSWLNEIRVEPILFIFSLAIFLYTSVARSLMGQKICFPDGPPGIEVICKDEDRLKEINYLNSVSGSMRECLPAVIALFAGSWRDATGLSRPLIILAHIGELIASSVDMFSYYKWDLSPWFSVLAGSLPGGLCGSRPLVTVAGMSYITDRTTHENRTSRMTAMVVAVLGGTCIASAASGYILLLLDYPGAFVGLIVVYIANMCLTFLLVVEERRDTGGQSPGIFNSVKRLKIVFYSKPNQLVIWFCLSSACVITSLLTAEATIAYTFLMKVVQMNVTDIGLFSSYKLFVSLISAAVLVPIMKNVLKLSDFKVAFICTIPSVVSCIGMAFAQTRTQVYIFATLDFMRIVLISTIWSLLSRCIKKSEIGVYSSFLTVGDSLLPVVLNPLFAYIFGKTIDTLPGAFYLMSGASLAIISVLIVISSYFYIEIPEEEESGVVSAAKSSDTLDTQLPDDGA